MVCEIYSDYECPWCAGFCTQVFPKFVAEFVKTGKVRVVHRDFPLPQHPFAKLAARYANAAGEVGHFEEVEKQLFVSQLRIPLKAIGHSGGKPITVPGGKPIRRRS